VGFFDTVHTGARCGQVKVFDRRDADLCPGDDVPAVPDPAGGPPLTDLAIEMPAGGWVVVTEGRIASWVDEQPHGLPVVNSRGSP
jgi:hypothetical protein